MLAWLGGHIGKCATNCFPSFLKVRMQYECWGRAFGTFLRPNTFTEEEESGRRWVRLVHSTHVLQSRSQACFSPSVCTCMSSGGFYSSSSSCGKELTKLFLSNQKRKSHKRPKMANLVAPNSFLNFPTFLNGKWYTSPSLPKPLTASSPPFAALLLPFRGRIRKHLE